MILLWKTKALISLLMQKELTVPAQKNMQGQWCIFLVHKKEFSYDAARQSSSSLLLCIRLAYVSLVPRRQCSVYYAHSLLRPACAATETNQGHEMLPKACGCTKPSNNECAYSQLYADLRSDLHAAKNQITPDSKSFVMQYLAIIKHFVKINDKI